MSCDRLKVSQFSLLCVNFNDVDEIIALNRVIVFLDFSTFFIATYFIGPKNWSVSAKRVPAVLVVPAGSLIFRKCHKMHAQMWQQIIKLRFYRCNNVIWNSWLFCSTFFSVFFNDFYFKMSVRVSSREYGKKIITPFINL